MLRTVYRGLAAGMAISVIALSGCVTHAYSSDPQSRGEALQPLPPQSADAPLPPPAPSPEPPPPPAKKSLRAKIVGLFNSRSSEKCEAPESVGVVADTPPSASGPDPLIGGPSPMRQTQQKPGPVAASELPPPLEPSPQPLPQKLPPVAFPKPRSGPPPMQSDLLPSAMSGPPPMSSTGVPSMIPPVQAPTSKFTGTWVRSMDEFRTVVTLSEKRLTIEFQYAGFDETKAEARCTIRIGGDCAYGPEGTIFGVITDADIEGVKGLVGIDSDAIHKLMDEPFSAKVRVDDRGLFLREVRCASFGPTSKNPIQSAGIGRYQLMTGQPMPPLKPMPLKKKAEAPSTEPTTSRSSAKPPNKLMALLERAETYLNGFGMQTRVGGMTLPSPQYLQHFPQYYPANDPTAILTPVPVLPPVPGPMEFMQLFNYPPNVPSVMPAGGIIVPTSGKPAPERIPLIDEKNSR